MEWFREQRGQASVELVALLPVIALLAALLWQVAIAGQAVWLAGSAARAAARAKAVEGDAEQAARGALPESLERGLRVRAQGDGAVRVTVPVRGVLLKDPLTTVHATARFEPQGER